MDELIAQVLSFARAMWRRRWVGLMVAWVVAAVAGFVLWRTPDRYEATAKVFVDTKSVLKPLMRDLAVEPDIEQTVGLLGRTLITRPNIEVLMRKANLDNPSRSQPERDKMAEMLTREIKLAPVGRDNVFAFSYRDNDPQRARLVVENLVDLFVESDLGAKSRDTESARTFIDQQIKTYEVRLTEAENRLKDFKLRNLGMADISGRDYFTRMTALTEELSKLNIDLRASEQSRDALRRELSGETASLLPESPANAVIASPEFDARLDAQRRQLDELLRRYTELHPDVVAARRLIARLEEQKQQDLDARRKIAESKPRVAVAATPGQQQVKLALAEAEASVAALRVRVSDTQSRLNELRASATRAPKIEAELAQLNRDYDVVRRNYEALVGRREKASMSEEVDATRQAQFRVIEPPRTADKPVFPNRLALIPFALIVALAAGVAATFLMVQLVPTVDTARALRGLTNRPVLGSVSMLRTDDLVRRVRRQGLAFVSGTGALIFAYAAWMAWIIHPLHV